MGIRDILNDLPAPGSIKKVPVAGLGDVPVKRLSGEEYQALPDENFALQLAVASLVDEEGLPLFTKPQDITDRHLPTVRAALIQAAQSVNNVQLEEAIKK